MRRNEKDKNGGRLITMSVLEAMHRRVVSDLNTHRGWDLTYYKDAEIDPTIYRLVELLNNPWTITTHSCGGHWDLPPRFQYPYVAMRLHSHPEEWCEIVRWMCLNLVEQVTPKATLIISQGYRLPAMQMLWMEWRFGPERLSSKLSRDLFSDETDFRATLDGLIDATCRALERVMNASRYAGELANPRRCTRR